MLSIMRDESQPREVRLDAAKSAAPYVHPRLASVTADIAIRLMTNDDAEERGFALHAGASCLILARWRRQSVAPGDDIAAGNEAW